MGTYSQNNNINDIESYYDYLFGLNEIHNNRKNMLQHDHNEEKYNYLFGLYKKKPTYGMNDESTFEKLRKCEQMIKQQCDKINKLQKTLEELLVLENNRDINYSSDCSYDDYSDFTELSIDENKEFMIEDELYNEKNSIKSSIDELFNKGNDWGINSRAYVEKKQINNEMEENDKRNKDITISDGNDNTMGMVLENIEIFPEEDIDKINQSSDIVMKDNDNENKIIEKESSEMQENTTVIKNTGDKNKDEIAKIGNSVGGVIEEKENYGTSCLIKIKKDKKENNEMKVKNFKILITNDIMDIENNNKNNILKCDDNDNKKNTIKKNKKRYYNQVEKNQSPILNNKKAKKSSESHDENEFNKENENINLDENIKEDKNKNNMKTKNEDEMSLGLYEKRKIGKLEIELKLIGISDYINIINNIGQTGELSRIIYSSLLLLIVDNRKKGRKSSKEYNEMLKKYSKWSDYIKRIFKNMNMNTEEILSVNLNNDIMKDNGYSLEKFDIISKNINFKMVENLEAIGDKVIKCKKINNEIKDKIIKLAIYSCINKNKYTKESISEILKTVKSIKNK